MPPRHRRAPSGRSAFVSPVLRRRTAGPRPGMARRAPGGRLCVPPRPRPLQVRRPRRATGAVDAAGAARRPGLRTCRPTNGLPHRPAGRVVVRGPASASRRVPLIPAEPACLRRLHGGRAPRARSGRPRRPGGRRSSHLPGPSVRRSGGTRPLNSRGGAAGGGGGTSRRGRGGARTSPCRAASWRPPAAGRRGPRRAARSRSRARRSAPGGGARSR